MAKSIAESSNSRSLEVQKLQVTSYKIISVDVAKELDQLRRRFAVATVVSRNIEGNWKNNTHLIELKHCYNYLSKGPKTTPYKDLPGRILEIAHIGPGTKLSDLEVVTWSLHYTCD